MTASVAGLGVKQPASNATFEMGPAKMPLVHALVLSGEPLKVAKEIGSLLGGADSTSPPSVQVTCVLQRNLLVLLLLARHRGEPEGSEAQRKVLWAASMERLRAAFDRRGKSVFAGVSPPTKRGVEPILLAFDTEKSCRVVKRHIERHRQRLRSETMKALGTELDCLARVDLSNQE